MYIPGTRTSGSTRYIVAGLLAVAALGLAALIGLTSSLSVIPRTIVWGAYSATSFPDFEASAGRPVDIVAIFVGFHGPFPANLEETVAGMGKTLLIFWEPGSNHSDILSGTYDASIRAFADAAQTYQGEVIFVPFNEPNLYEPHDAPTPWGFGADGNTAESFKQAWRHVHDTFGSYAHVKWGLAYNNTSIPEDPENTIENLYPGDEYVDYVGLDGFNGYEGWQSAEEIFGQSLEEIRAFKKPIYIFSVASMEGEKKAAWITDFFSWLKANQDVVGFVWFNEHKEFDWTIDSDPDALRAFRAGLGST